MNVPEYDPKGWHVTFIMWGILLICTVLNTWLGMILPVIEVFILIVHVLGFFAVLIPLVYLGPRADPRSVFTLTFNFGGWHDITLATFVGLKGTVAAFLGKTGHYPCRLPVIRPIDSLDIFLGTDGAVHVSDCQTLAPDFH